MGSGIGVAVYVDDLTYEGLIRLLDDVPRETRVEIYTTISAGRHYARRWECAGVVRDNSPALACIEPDRLTRSPLPIPGLGRCSPTWWVFVEVDRLDDEGRRALREFLGAADAAGEEICWVAARGGALKTVRAVRGPAAAALRAELAQ